ncbi:TetR/AcrR family transcriptional regulator [Roseovarius salinarum]|uniref:TetR/AcrR family transcriptional regulator n=1 Tax=Roseovarius salinarum TaxID=1981892 RepID=UPI000C34C7C0|nr:TetR/AcrR family transcriptional regulator [Roseovarius salinarum]
MAASGASRLDPDAWLDAGAVALAESGPEALKAEPLARRLGTTKGSFYWHFADVPTFHAALLARWEDTARAGIAAAEGSQDTAVSRLRRFGQEIAAATSAGDGAPALEPAIRAWARGDANARATVHRVDELRLLHLQALLARIGISNPEMARIIYASSIGMMDLAGTSTEERAAALGSLVDLVLALR